MSAFGLPKFSKCVVGFASLLSLAGAVTASPAQGAAIDFRDWRPLGDVDAQMGGLSISTNALRSDDDFKNDGVTSPDTDFNYSGNPAIDISQLEPNLELPPSSLDPDTSQSALEGSGIIKTQLNLTQTTTLSLDWTFFTNETFATNESGKIEPFPDYAFISINGVINPLASALQQSLSPSTTTYHTQISGSFSSVLSAGVYSIALGVVDVNDLVVSSALVVNNAELISQEDPHDSDPRSDDHNGEPVTIPEPSSVSALLLFSSLGMGTKLWRSRNV